jgi:hypothetical protein
MERVWHLLFVGLLLMGMVTPSGFAQNVVRNASMEEGLDAPAEWLFWTRTTGQGVWDEQVARSG